MHSPRKTKPDFIPSALIMPAKPIVSIELSYMGAVANFYHNNGNKEVRKAPQIMNGRRSLLDAGMF